MANTYTQIYIHIVFAVQNRTILVSSSRKERLQKYITGIIQNQGHKLIAINTMPDHAHIFIGMKPDGAFRIWCAMLKETPRTLSIRNFGCGGNSAGRKGLEHLAILTRKLIPS